MLQLCAQVVDPYIKEHSFDYEKTYTYDNIHYPKDSIYIEGDNFSPFENGIILLFESKMHGITDIANNRDEHADDSYGWIDGLYQDGVGYYEKVQYEEWDPSDYIFDFTLISFFVLRLGLHLDHIFESTIYYWIYRQINLYLNIGLDYDSYTLFWVIKIV